MEFKPFFNKWTFSGHKSHVTRLWTSTKSVLNGEGDVSDLLHNDMFNQKSLKLSIRSGTFRSEGRKIFNLYFSKNFISPDTFSQSEN